MWNPRKHQEVLEDEDSWEVRAFAEDTRNIMATTWPPRSYSCTFCRREFRSAQALGGHMNVHRRDRARLHHHHQPLPPVATAIAVPASSPNPIITPSSSSHHPRLPNHHQELSVANGSGGLRLLYHLPSPNNNDNTRNGAPFSITHHHHHRHGHNTNTALMSACNNKLPCSTTTLVSVSSHPPNHNVVVRPTCSPSFNFAMAQGASGTNGFSSTKVEESSSSSRGFRHDELDLELRLGHKSPHRNKKKN